MPVHKTASMQQAEKNGFTDIEAMLDRLPYIGDQTPQTITANTIAINSQCPDQRLKFVLERLVRHLHDFAREVTLNTEEWLLALKFLTQVGQISSDIRHEFILLSDILGLSVLVDSQSHPKPAGCTESTVLGPFHTEDAEEKEHGGAIASEGKGQTLYISGTVTDTAGNGISDAAIDLWETDEHGFYDVQYADRISADCRGIVRTDASGNYAVKAVVPVSYPIPNDGPVGKLLKILGRHCFRPAHIHFKIDVPGFEQLVTAVYLKGDPFITSDAVFGVKDSLIVELKEQGDGSFRLVQNFVMASNEEAEALRKEQLSVD